MTSYNNLCAQAGPRSVILGDPPVFAGAAEKVVIDPGLGEALDTLATKLAIERWIVILAAWSGFVARACEGSQSVIGFLPAAREGASVFPTPALNACLCGVAGLLAEQLSSQPLEDDPTTAVEVWGFSHADDGGDVVQEKSGVCLVVEKDVLRLVSDRYAPYELSGLLLSFATFLSAALCAPDAAIGELETVSKQDRGWLLARGRGSAFVATVATVPEMVRAQSVRTPDSVAVRSVDEALTYAELRARARDFEDGLRRSGVGRGDRVAIMLPRCIDLLPAILATMDAGAVFVPIGLDQPPAFRDLLLADIDPKLVICREADCTLMTGATCLTVEAVVGPNLTAAPYVLPHPNDLAYIMFTSGSSGSPKGVMVTHEGFANYVRFAADTYFTQPGGAAMATSIGFDLSLTSLLVPLVVGQCVHMIDDALGLMGLIELDRRFSVIKATPSHLSLARRAGVLDALCRKTTTFVLGGEPLTATLAAQIRSSAPGVRIFNEYGPTETVVGSTIREVDDDDLNGAAIAIGLPIHNTECLVLDARGRMVPPGWPGELFIGGAGVSPGYWRRPDLTQERFVELPWAGPGRYYRTGDLVRWSVRAGLVFLGRTDSQVKVHGIRVELAGVRAAILEHPDVADAVVVAVEKTEDERALRAYVVRGATVAIDEAAVRDFLIARTPRWMIPGEIIVLDTLPTTNNGKFDMRALPEAARQLRPRSVQHTLTVVREVWARILRRDDLRDDQNILDAGGTSFEAIQIVLELNEALELQLRPMDIFQQPTIAAMAAFIDGESKTARPVEAARERAALRLRLTGALAKREEPRS